MIYSVSDITYLSRKYRYKSVISYNGIDSNSIQKIRLICFPHSKIIFLKNNVICRFLYNISVSFNIKGNNMLFLTNDFFLIRSLFLSGQFKFSVSLLLSGTTCLSIPLTNSLLLYSNIGDIYLKLCFLLRSKVLYLTSLLKSLTSGGRKNF
ncbi:50S ribosomal protein L10 [Candidatus Vidania fulgoroideorum]